VRLLTRTTRSVSPTEAGERLMQNVAPRLEEIEAEIAAVSDLGDKAGGHHPHHRHRPRRRQRAVARLAKVLEQYPDVRVEISTDYRMVDIAAERYDIGVRYGDQVQKDMVAVRLTPDIPMTIVAAPRYFETHKVPVTCRTWRGTTASRCACPAGRHLCLGTARRRARGGGARQRPGHLQRRLPDAERGAQRLWAGLPARGTDAAACGCRAGCAA
jgi:DNA-binding transcriptional LysR family regulator